MWPSRSGVGGAPQKPPNAATAAATPTTNANWCRVGRALNIAAASTGPGVPVGEGTTTVVDGWSGEDEVAHLIDLRLVNRFLLFLCLSVRDMHIWPESSNTLMLSHAMHPVGLMCGMDGNGKGELDDLSRPQQ